MDGFSIPDFSVSQDTNRVYIDVRCAEVSAGGTAATPNIAVEGRIFGFHLEPYYLPLVLPGAATRCDVEHVSDSSQDGSRHFRVTLNKIQPGEQFEGLDQLQPQLLPEEQMKQAVADAEQSKGFFQPAQGNSSSSRATDDAAKALLQQALQSQGLTALNDDDGEASFDSSAVQVASRESSNAHTRSKGHGFGFRNSFTSSLIPAGCADTRNLLEVSHPDTFEPAQREQAALEFEEQQWDEGIYMDNFLDIDGELAHLLRFQPSIPSSSVSDSSSSDESAKADVEALALILQLLFAYSYDERTNEGDPTVESGWTISKLCRSLAASTPPQLVSDASLESAVSSALIGCARRALTIPLYRHWGLTIACINDTRRRLEADNAYVRDCLLRIASRLEEGEDAILCRLSEVWLAPLLAHFPTQDQLNQLVRCVEQIMEQPDAVTKDKVGRGEWDLEVLEEAAKQAYEDGEGGFV